MKARFAIAAFASFASAAMALDTPTWPPPAEVGSRMRELQLVIIDRDSTPPQREAAREELSSLLKSPAGQSRGRTADEKPRPARASIDPLPGAIVPAPAPPPAAVPPSGIARIEVVEPPRRFANPRTGSIPVPTSRFAIDPRTGSVLHEIPGGYIDPLTGIVTPR